MTSPLIYEYQWQRDGAPIAGATADRYTLQAADAGRQVACTVTAANSAGSVAATSAATGTVAGAPGETGALFTRASFGAYALDGGTANHVALEAEVGATLKRYVTYQVMGTGGGSNWPAADAQWCQATGHTLDIAWDIAASGPTFADILGGGNDASLDAFFQECRTFDGQVILRMWWEMNEGTGPTKVGNDILCTSTAQWVQTWRYVVDRCRVVNGCTNVKFFFCANGSDDIPGVTMEQFWPGLDYVDEAGIDTYNETHYATWTPFDQKVAPMLNRVIALAPDLPLAIGEIGTVNTGGPSGTDAAEWLNGLFTSQQWPNLRYINFFSVDQTPSGGNNYRVDQTPQSLAACQQYLRAAPEDVDG